MVAMAEQDDATDLHFRMGQPIPVGEPMVDRNGQVIGTVVSCTDDCGEAFHVVVRPVEAAANDT